MGRAGSFGSPWKVAWLWWSYALTLLIFKQPAHPASSVAPRGRSHRLTFKVAHCTTDLQVLHQPAAAFPARYSRTRAAEVEGAGRRNKQVRGWSKHVIGSGEGKKIKVMTVQGTTLLGLGFVWLATRRIVAELKASAWPALAHFTTSRDDATTWSSLEKGSCEVTRLAALSGCGRESHVSACVHRLADRRPVGERYFRCRYRHVGNDPNPDHVGDGCYYIASVGWTETHLRRKRIVRTTA